MVDEEAGALIGCSLGPELTVGLDDEEEVVSEVAAVEEAGGVLGWVEAGSFCSAGALAGAAASELGSEAAGALELLLGTAAALLPAPLEASLLDEAAWSEETSAAERSSGRLAAAEDAPAGVATGGGVPEAVAEGACAIGAGTVGDEAGIGGGGGATSVTTGALASAFASAVADLDRCLAAGRP